VLYRIFKESIRLPPYEIYVCYSLLVYRVGTRTTMTMTVIRSPAEVCTHSSGTIVSVLITEETFLTERLV